MHYLKAVKSTSLRVALYFFKFVTTKSYLGLLLVQALHADKKEWAT